MRNKFNSLQLRDKSQTSARDDFSRVRFQLINGYESKDEKYYILTDNCNDMQKAKFDMVVRLRNDAIDGKTPKEIKDYLREKFYLMNFQIICSLGICPEEIQKHKKGCYLPAGRLAKSIFES